MATAVIFGHGTAFGIFNVAGGCALLLSSVIAGSLWSTFGVPATFLAGAVFAILALLGLLAYGNKLHAVRG